MRQLLLLVGVLVLCGCQSVGIKGQPEASSATDVTRTRWSGTWVDHRRENYGGELHCDARQVSDNQWQARFYGNCGRDYSYQLELVGTLDGERVKFEGDVDLGAADGGMYTWVGYMDGNEFVGEYRTVAGKAGSFTMIRLHPTTTH